MPFQSIEPRRLYRQIADQIRTLIGSGEFPAGSRLPSERDLAKQLGEAGKRGSLTDRGRVWLLLGKATTTTPFPLLDYLQSLYRDEPPDAASDLDRIPFPDLSLLRPEAKGFKHMSSIPVLTSRGCPYKCTYCSKPITGDTWRPRSVSTICRTRRSFRSSERRMKPARTIWSSIS